jgi:hypothetical protein
MSWWKPCLSIAGNSFIVTQVSIGEALAAIFKALSDPTRLRILECLACCSDVEISEEGDCRPAGSLSVGGVNPSTGFTSRGGTRV